MEKENIFKLYNIDQNKIEHGFLDTSNFTFNLTFYDISNGKEWNLTHLHMLLYF